MNKYEEFKYRKRIFTKEEVEDIINSYENNNESCVSLAKRYDITHKAILKILHKYNVNVDGRSHRKYELNEEYFDVIDTPNKAYILGFFFADGSINQDKQTVAISLQEEDGYILEAMRKEIGSEKPLEYLDYSNKHDFGYHYKNQYRLLMFSSHMCQSLSNIGMVQNKSLVLEFPDIPEELYPHFIRGYFDGDGCINKDSGGFGIISTYNFVNSVKNILQEKLGVENGKLNESSNHNGITYDLHFHRKAESKIIFDWLYKDAKLFLIRKYIIYMRIHYSYNILVA